MRYFTFTALILASLIQSCTFIYKTADVDSSLRSNVQEVDNAVASLNSQFQEAIKTYNDIPCEKSGYEYQLANSKKEQVTQDFELLKTKQAEVHSTYDKFRSYTSGMDQISSKSPQWDMLKQTKEDMKSELDAFSETNKQLVNDASAFIQTVQTEIINKLEKVDIPSYTQAFRKSMEEGTEAELVLKRNFQELKTSAATYIAAAKSSNPSECEKISESINQYEIQIQNLSNVLSKLEKAFHTFEKQSKMLPSTLYSCSPLYQVIKENEAQMDRFQASINEIQSKMNEIRAGFPKK